MADQQFLSDFISINHTIYLYCVVCTKKYLLSFINRMN